VTQPLPHAGSGTRRSTEGADRPRVLVVDDDVRVRQVLQWALEDEGFAVETAEDGRQALARATEHPPDLVVLDITLPILNGYMVARALRETHGAQLPVLAITGDGQAPLKAERAGAYAYLRKPFDVAELVAAVRRGLEPAPVTGARSKEQGAGSK
jgi:DNA-binding response OmpR family regulator